MQSEIAKQLLALAEFFETYKHEKKRSKNKFQNKRKQQY